MTLNPSEWTLFRQMLPGSEGFSGVYRCWGMQVGGTLHLDGYFLAFLLFSFRMVR